MKKDINCKNQEYMDYIADLKSIIIDEEFKNRIVGEVNSFKRNGEIKVIDNRLFCSNNDYYFDVIIYPIDIEEQTISSVTYKVAFENGQCFESGYYKNYFNKTYTVDISSYRQDEKNKIAFDSSRVGDFDGKEFSRDVKTEIINKTNDDIITKENNAFYKRYDDFITKKEEVSILTESGSFDERVCDYVEDSCYYVVDNSFYKKLNDIDYKEISRSEFEKLFGNDKVRK